MTKRKQPVPTFNAIEGAVAATNMLLREGLTAVPVVSIEYDGTGEFKNDDIIPYLKYPRRNVALDQKMAL